MGGLCWGWGSGEKAIMIDNLSNAMDMVMGVGPKGCFLAIFGEIGF